MGMFKKVRGGLYSIKSLLIHGRFKTPRWDYRHHVIPPITSSTAFRLDSARRAAKGFIEFAKEYDKKKYVEHPPIYIYDRLGEPTRGILEENLAFAEKGDIAITFSSGMAAISASLGVTLSSGDEVITHRTLYGCTYSLFHRWYPRYRIGVKTIDLTDLSALKKEINTRTRAIYFETPSNPTMELIDISGVSEIVKAVNKKRKKDEKIRTIVDNTFATPFCQRPITLGADMVVHSLTKNICGFGTDMGGAVITSRLYEHDLLYYRKDLGGVLPPKSAWDIMVFGLSTLSLRLEAQERSAKNIAQFLKNHDKVERVSYPGLKSFPQYDLAQRQMIDFDDRFAPGSMLYFVLKGSYELALKKGKRLINYLAKEGYTITLAVSLGQIRTLVEHPSSMTHAEIPPKEQVKDGIEPGGIRLSVGIEPTKDIIYDLSRALDRI